MDVVSRMNIVIIGGGITGLFCAHYLMRDKHKVTVIEKSGTGSATSIYNAGLLTPSISATARKGLGKIISTYLGREGPVYSSPREVLANPRWFRIALRKGLRGYEDKIVEMGHASLKLYKEFFAEVGFRPDVVEGVVAVYAEEADARIAHASLGGKLLDEASVSQMGVRGSRGGATSAEEIPINPAKLYKTHWQARLKRSRPVR